MKSIVWLLLALAFALIAGCGGGGGGSSTPPTTITLTGNVLWVETGAGTTPATTVRIGNVSAAAASADGYFSIDVPAGNQSLTATYTASTGSTPVVTTFSLGSITSSGDVGELFIGPSTINVTGRLLDSTTSSPISGAAVSFAGRSAQSGPDGRFTVPNVAYSATTQAVFFGIQGLVTDSGYFSQAFLPPGPAVSGAVDVGDVVLVPQGSTTPPNTPYDLVVTVNPVATSPGATVTVSSGSTVIRTTTADGAGHAYFWITPGTYTIKATKGASTISSSYTLADQTIINGATVTLP